jgi:acid phosphatase class B
MKNFKNFEIQLLNAIKFAAENEKPTKKEIDLIKETLKVGITYGQFDIVKRVYNSTLRSIKYKNKTSF